MKKHLLAGLALAGALLSAPASAAVSVGDSVTCGALNFTCSVSRATVGSGTEFALELDQYGVALLADFSAGLLTIRNAGNPVLAGGFGLPDDFALYFSNETSTLDFADLGDVDGVFGLDAGNLSLDRGALTIDLSNVDFLDSSSFQVNLNAPVTPPTGAVPEPATWAMMILGFGVVGAALRRRKTAAVSRALA
ncbi:hypothetical protein J2Y58_001576 [Sphingomonas sp. BE138]|uniref:PEPxxWA-CTERM sorting domain-containing protein n=1 Tax=Sphingomonas sp. BE138 TaxID=2817845 RepID=UPI002855BF4A|nr:PEPxxWA-CTERM sorting domain-containing protein [Sphingomonas sp. BE138]MDR6788218.1 hypothetical protein [Sphingomonas sp. BE138]